MPYCILYDEMSLHFIFLFYLLFFPYIIWTTNPAPLHFKSIGISDALNKYDSYLFTVYHYADGF